GWVGQRLRARQTLGGEEVSDRAHATFLERVEDRLLKEPRAGTAHPREAAPTFEGRDGGAVGIMGEFPVGHLVGEDGGQGVLAELVCPLSHPDNLATNSRVFKSCEVVLER